ncbi:hypothetical protein CPB84DRAFT_1796947 [Gymnopilus junonius]|uniref:Uncharacterized protein n=1 Tax=Gymnopilus junonius TaxID=109634 RepID=A0A9P5N8Q8_GYMJU|nr:hypothetical protein CPB84DRAFT_1796947 [Gymnopilus junonius]
MVALLLKYHSRLLEACLIIEIAEPTPRLSVRTTNQEKNKILCLRVNLKHIM